MRFVYIILSVFLAFSPVIAQEPLQPAEPHQQSSSVSATPAGNSTLPAYPDPATEARIKSMQPFFEAVINCIYGMEGDWNGQYSSKDSKFMWDVLFYLTTSYTSDLAEVSQADGAFLIPKKTMQDFATVLFADYSDLPPLPADMEIITYEKAQDLYKVGMSDVGGVVFNMADISPMPAGKYRVKIVLLDDEEVEVFGTYFITLTPNLQAGSVKDDRYSFSIENVTAQ